MSTRIAEKIAFEQGRSANVEYDVESAIRARVAARFDEIGNNICNLLSFQIPTTACNCDPYHAAHVSGKSSSPRLT
jgi:hypothetical protein